MLNVNVQFAIFQRKCSDVWNVLRQHQLVMQTCSACIQFLAQSR